MKVSVNGGCLSWFVVGRTGSKSWSAHGSLYESLRKSLFFKRLSVFVVTGNNNYAPAMPVFYETVGAESISALQGGPGFNFSNVV